MRPQLHGPRETCKLACVQSGEIMSDPVTPQGVFEFNRPTIISLLYLVGALTVVTSVVGVVLAYIWKGDAHQPWEATHYTYHIRTFWIALVAGIVGTVTLILGIGFLILAAIGVWAIVRCMLSLVAAQKRAPMPNPETLLF